MGSWFMRGDIRTAVGNASDGVVGQLGGGHQTRLGANDHVVLDASLDWADSKYTATYFGVTAAQALTSGLAAYNAGSGIKSYGIGANWTHSFADGWFSNVGVRYKSLNGDAANSPIVQRKTQMMSMAAVGYRF